MTLLSRRAVYAVAAVLDVALHARPTPVSAKMLAARQKVGPRHLESVLNALVRANILKGIRGPRGGYELARERRRISVGEIVRASERLALEEEPGSDLVARVIGPAIDQAGRAFLDELDRISVEDLCGRAGIAPPEDEPRSPEFTI